MSENARAVILCVPSLPRIVFDLDGDADVFDAWAWCESDVLEWRMPVDQNRLHKAVAVDGENPSELLFVFRNDADATILPRELAALHASGYGFDAEWALAPYAIDDATDVLYERRIRPRDVLWLAASSLRALVWGLHDWAHFHNHGPFDQPALTELHCDLVGLTWLRLNAETIGLVDDDLANVQRDLVALSRARFASEGKKPPVPDLDGLFADAYSTIRESGRAPSSAPARELARDPRVGGVG